MTFALVVMNFVFNNITKSVIHPLVQGLFFVCFVAVFVLYSKCKQFNKLTNPGNLIPVQGTDTFWN